MAIFRMYTGSDGQSQLEEQSIAAHPILSEARPAVHIQFRELPADTFMDWHPAPRRQYVIVLGGQLELGFKDGTKKRLNPGDATLAEDISGPGHTTRVVGSGPAITAIVPLA
jgi:quercetin dioxygenase-like cupin family protein